LNPESHALNSGSKTKLKITFIQEVTLNSTEFAKKCGYFREAKGVFSIAELSQTRIFAFQYKIKHQKNV
jgi:hypothetical protein